MTKENRMQEKYQKCLEHEANIPKYYDLAREICEELQSSLNGPKFKIGMEFDDEGYASFFICRYEWNTILYRTCMFEMKSFSGLRNYLKEKIKTLEEEDKKKKESIENKEAEEFKNILKKYHDRGWLKPIMRGVLDNVRGVLDNE